MSLEFASSNVLDDVRSLLVIKSYRPISYKDCIQEVYSILTRFYLGKILGSAALVTDIK